MPLSNGWSVGLGFSNIESTLAGKFIHKKFVYLFIRESEFNPFDWNEIQRSTVKYIHIT